jgi:cell division septation protein DedD
MPFRRTRVLVAVLAMTLVAGRAAAQSDARIVAALRLAQDGRIDSARSALAVLEKAVPPTDTAFSQVLYAQGLVAPTVDEARQRLQRVVSEYPLSAWSDDAVVRLAQLEYANGDPAAAARQLEKFHGDYAASSLFPTAAVWAGRSLLRAKDTLAGCRWVSEGLGRAGQDAATRKELAGLQATCGGKVTVAKEEPPKVARVDSAPTAPAPVKPAAQAWRIQVVAAQTPAQADEQVRRAKQAGFDAIVVREGEYHKVRLGTYATRADAVAGLAKVRTKLGGQPFVVQDK